MDEIKQDRIDRYILGQLSEDEKIKFEEDLFKDIELYEQYKYTNMLKETISSQAHIEELMCQWDKELYENREEAHYPKWNKKIWYWTSAIAAIFIATIFIIAPYKSSSDIKYETFINEYSRNSGNELYQIDSLLIKKNYSYALILIENTEKKVNISLYQFNETVNKEQQEQLEYELQEIKRYSDDLTWMKIYALIGLNREKEALSLLGVLKVKDGFYKEKADSLYQKIKK